MAHAIQRLERFLKFDELHTMLPYVTEGQKHSNVYDVYENVRCKFPGKHAMDTDPVGGDFVIEVNCSKHGWDWKQFTHADIFNDIETKTDADLTFMQESAAPELCSIVLGSLAPQTLATQWPAVKSASVLVSMSLKISA